MKAQGEIPHKRYLFDRETHLKYRWLMKTLESSLSFNNSQVARFRLHTLEYYYRYGLRPTLDAFGVKKSTRCMTGRKDTNLQVKDWLV